MAKGGIGHIIEPYQAKDRITAPGSTEVVVHRPFETSRTARCPLRQGLRLEGQSRVLPVSRAAMSAGSVFGPRLPITRSESR